MATTKTPIGVPTAEELTNMPAAELLEMFEYVARAAGSYADIGGAQNITEALFAYREEMARRLGVPV